MGPKVPTGADMRQHLKLVSLALLILFTLSIGFGLGFIRGLNEGAYFREQATALLSTVYLQKLRSGEIDWMIDRQERVLENAIIDYGTWLNLRVRFIEYIDPHLTDHSQIRRAVAYRLDNPYPTWDASDPSNWKPGADMESDLMKDMIAMNKERLEIYESVIERFSP